MVSRQISPRFLQLTLKNIIVKRTHVCKMRRRRRRRMPGRAKDLLFPWAREREMQYEEPPL